MTSIDPKGEITDKPLKLLSPDEIKVLVHESSRGLSLVRTAYFDSGENLNYEQRKMILQLAEADQLAEIQTDYILESLKESVGELYKDNAYTFAAQNIRELNNILTLANIPPNEAPVDRIYEIFNAKSTPHAEMEFEGYRRTILSELANTFLTIKSHNNISAFLMSTLKEMIPIRLSTGKNGWGFVHTHEYWIKHPGYIPVLTIRNGKSKTEFIKYEDAALLNCDTIAAELKKDVLQPFKKYV